MGSNRMILKEVIRVKFTVFSKLDTFDNSNYSDCMNINKFDNTEEVAMSKKIYTFDTTLRDGEQTPGVNLNEWEKVDIAIQLERLEIDFIEAGFAAASPGDLQAIRAVAKAVQKSTVISLARTSRDDIDAVYEALKGIDNVGIHIFIATSPIHMEKKLRMTKEQVLEQAVESVKYAAKYFEHIEFSFEDSTRSDIEFLCDISEKIILAGANVLNFPDTVGYMTPIEYAKRFQVLQEKVKGIHKVNLSCHCHDDLGLAVSNTLAAIQAGVVQVEGCINGIGERAGNVALEEVALALETRYDVYQIKTSLELKEIARTSKLVSRLTGMPIPANKAIVGNNAFAHQSGIHQDGVIKDKRTYEIMEPETVGFQESKLILGKLSGRHALKEKLNELGFEVDDQSLKEIFDQFKILADKKKELMDEDLIALIENRIIKNETVFYNLVHLYISYSNNGTPIALVGLKLHDGTYTEEAAKGNGSIDAIYKAIDNVVEEQVELVDYKITSVTQGRDALGEVFVRIKQRDIIVQGRGISTDILEASALAYIDALNRIKNLNSRNKIKTIGV
jgi:2-isopropylmalate synthase